MCVCVCVCLYLQLAVEREELLRALRIESSNCSKLKVLSTTCASVHKMPIPNSIVKPWVLVYQLSSFYISENMFAGQPVKFCLVLRSVMVHLLMQLTLIS
jgi:hypothetical protein